MAVRDYDPVGDVVVEAFDLKVIHDLTVFTTSGKFVRTSSLENLNTHHPRCSKTLVFLASKNFHFFVRCVRPSTSTATFVVGQPTSTL
jgi:hypothetical protein